jgi:hypothetical protein
MHPNKDGCDDFRPRYFEAVLMGLLFRLQGRLFLQFL